MTSATDDRDPQSLPHDDIAWTAVWTGYAIAAMGTLLAGAWGLASAGKGMWWVANAGVCFLVVGGLAASVLAKTAEPLNGAFIAVLYFATFTLIIFVGEFLALLPDPLPGLPRGDSTFYFVWPLAQLAAATVGAVAGGWLHARYGRRSGR